MATEIQTLLTKRNIVKRQLKAFFTFVEAEEGTLSELQERYERIQETFQMFLSLSMEVECLNKDEQAIKDLIENTAVYEKHYYQIMGRVKEKFKNENSTIAQVIPDSTNNQGNYTGLKVKLPPLTITPFSGAYDEWLSFKDSYSKAVHDQEGLPNVQKFQILRGLLKGDALKMISAFEATESNYKEAWKLLNDRYSNKRVIINTHVKGLFDLPSVTKGNSSNLRHIVDTTRTHLRSLKTLGESTDTWDTIVTYLMASKLDNTSREEWEKDISCYVGENEEDEQPSLEDFLKFLERRCSMLEMIENKRTKQDTPLGTGNNKREKKLAFVATTPSTSSTATRSGCYFCSGQHGLFNCERFLKLSPEGRNIEILRLKLCLNCLRKGHFRKECKSLSCGKCGSRHNTLLHKDSIPAGKNPSTQQQVPKQVQQENAIVTHCTPSQVIRVLLSTAQVHVADRDGNQHRCRALLDPGSQINMITEDFAKKLRIKCRSIQLPVTGVNQFTFNVRNSLQVVLSSMTSRFTTQQEFLLTPKITQHIPQVRIDRQRMFIPREIELADPDFDIPGQIDMLIGAGVFWKIINGGDSIRNKGQPVIQNTRLGWIVGGEWDGATIEKPSLSCHVLTNEGLDQQIERFWKTEEVQNHEEKYDVQEYCDAHFKKTYKRDQDGRFIVELPRNSQIKLGRSFEQASRRFKHLEKRFEENSELKDAYVKFLDDYVDKGHMSQLDKLDQEEDQHFYMPHHAVLRTSSLTTKLRVVFDASAKTTLGTSLNDMLLPGPNIQNDLLQILLRFRVHKYVMTADISQMFRQINVTQRDKNLQRILWRRNCDEPIEIFALNTVTYGTSCAPFLAMRCLREVAYQAENKFPRAADTIKEDFYMDDLLTGTNSLKEAIQLQKQLSHLLDSGQFPLRKWRANDVRILRSIRNSGRTDELLILDEQSPSKILGLLWDSKDDVLTFKINISQTNASTKREILSLIAQIYDPLGIIAPIIIIAKLVMQELWKLRLGWDEDVPSTLQRTWQTFTESFQLVEELRLDRNVARGIIEGDFIIHGFSDASEKALGACIYITTRNNNDEAQTHLLCAKSKVAPLKRISLPRLELCAALLLSRLIKIVKTALKLQNTEINLWSDSTITLCWIRTSPHNLKTFEANRVTEIQNLTRGCTWRHIQSKDNPADHVSRGVIARELLKLNQWWYGPSWIGSPNEWPEQILPEIEVPGLKSVITTTMNIKYDILYKFSSFKKLQRVVAYCWRFIDIKIRKRRHFGPLSVDELEEARIRILRMTQKEAFPLDITDLSATRSVHSKSRILTLNPFLDTDGLVKVGGRLENADITYEHKHPVVLPARHHITEIILRDEHERLLHCGPKHLLYSIRQKYWPLSGGRETRKIVRKCVACFKYRPIGPDMIMGNLPKPRVNRPAFPFETTGVDYAGPLQLRESRRRGRIHQSKGYIAVFVCFGTKAVHLELVSDLSTEAFLAALKRFIGRRGPCKTIYSDNATNFVGAARELMEIQKILNEDDIKTTLARQGIKWEFIPPRSPHFGGLWESAVKSIKRHLYTVTKGLLATFEEVSTLLVQIESVLNSRPLMPMSENVDDLTILTPAHFLLGVPLSDAASGCFHDVSDSQLSRWQHLQKLRDHFWKRWRNEYLQQLQNRGKWTKGCSNVKRGAMVLLKDDNLPPLRWAVGRIVEIYPGSDNIARVADVRTTQGIYRRSLRKLCILPFDQDI